MRVFARHSSGLELVNCGAGVTAVVHRMYQQWQNVPDPDALLKKPGWEELPRQQIDPVIVSLITHRPSSLRMDLDGTSEGAIKGWENRKHGGGDGEKKGSKADYRKEVDSARKQAFDGFRAVMPKDGVTDQHTEKHATQDEAAAYHNKTVSTLKQHGFKTVETGHVRGGATVKSITELAHETGGLRVSVGTHGTATKINFTRVVSSINPSDYDLTALDLDGTSEGAKKGWANRERGGDSPDGVRDRDREKEEERLSKAERAHKDKHKDRIAASSVSSEALRDIAARTSDDDVKSATKALRMLDGTPEPADERWAHKTLASFHEKQVEMRPRAQAAADHRYAAELHRGIEKKLLGEEEVRTRGLARKKD